MGAAARAAEAADFREGSKAAAGAVATLAVEAALEAAAISEGRGAVVAVVAAAEAMAGAVGAAAVDSWPPVCVIQYEPAFVTVRR